MSNNQRFSSSSASGSSYANYSGTLLTANVGPVDNHQGNSQTTDEGRSGDLVALMQELLVNLKGQQTPHFSGG